MVSGGTGGAERSSDQGDIEGLEAQGEAVWQLTRATMEQAEDNRETRGREEPGEAKGRRVGASARDPEVCGGSWGMTNRGLSGCTREPSRVLGPRLEMRECRARAELAGWQAEVETCAWRAEVQPASGGDEAWDVADEPYRASGGGRAEELDDTSGATNAGEWLKPPEEMGSGNLIETSEEEDLRMGPELLTVRTGLVRKTKVWGWVLGWELNPRTTDLWGSCLLLALGRTWSACLASGALVVISGSGSWTSPVGVSGSLTVRERPPFWSIQPKYPNHLWLSGLRRRRNTGESILSFFAVGVILS